MGMDDIMRKHEDAIQRHALTLSYILQLRDAEAAERPKRALAIWKEMAKSSKDPVQMGRCHDSLNEAQEYLSRHEEAGTDPVEGFKEDARKRFLTKHTAILSTESPESLEKTYKELSSKVVRGTPLSDIYLQTLTEAMRKVRERADRAGEAKRKQTARGAESRSYPLPSSTILEKGKKPRRRR